MPPDRSGDPRRGDARTDLVSAASEEIVAGRLRRHYTLTDRGAGVLSEKLTRMRQAADQAEARLKTREAFA